MSDVLQFRSEARVETLWCDYAKLAAQIADDPRLLADRPFLEQFTLAQDAWKRAFLSLRQEAI